MKQYKLLKLFAAISIVALILVGGCDCNPIDAINNAGKKMSGAAKKMDSVTTTISKDATGFSKHLESYVDTIKHQKDTSGSGR